MSNDRASALAVLRHNVGFDVPELWVDYAIRHGFRQVKAVTVGRCPDCGGQPKRSLGQFVYYSTLVRLVECGACGLACGGNTPTCSSGTCKATSPIVQGFTGNSFGPNYSNEGFAQCAGWKDTMAAGEIPDQGWATGCKVQNTTQVRIACGANAPTLVHS